MKRGDRVTYVSVGKVEVGIVKSLCDDPDFVFVVYHCGGDWEHFDNYTAARTRIGDLVLGWVTPPKKGDNEMTIAEDRQKAQTGERADRLAELGLRFNGSEFCRDDFNVHWTEILTDTDDEFDKKVLRIRVKMLLRTLLKPDYLGDGVYIKFDGFAVVLMANHHETPTDTIVLEPSVLEALGHYRDRIVKLAEEYKTAKEELTRKEKA
jgi:hypothetical protein